MSDQAFASFGECIYCGAVEGLSREHIVPFALGGTYVITAGSCEACRVITGEFERRCAQRMYGPLRGMLDYPTRRKGERARGIAVAINGGRPTRMKYGSIPVAPLIVPRLPTPGILRGEAPTNKFKFAWTEIRRLSPKNNPGRLQALRSEGVQTIGMTYEYNINSFMRILAKIGHCWAVAQYGMKTFTHILPPYILGLNDTLPYVVGAGMQKISLVPRPAYPVAAPGSLALFVSRPKMTVPVQPRNQGHALAAGIRFINGRFYVSTLVQLFRNFDLPTYEVIAGEATSELVKQSMAPVSV